MIDSEVFENNLLPFEIRQRYGTKAQCRCPSHDDKHASLTITKGKKCTLFYCHAGCSVDAILAAAGLEKKDTFYDTEPRKANWKTYIEGRENRKIEAVYNYFSINGGYAFTKIRLEGKKIIYGKLQDDRFSYGLGHDVGRKSYKAIYGNIQALKKAVSEGKPVFIPEGEKDVDTLTKQRYTAFTYGGVNDWQSEFAKLVQGAEVFILADNDEAGKRVAETIQNDIKAVVKSCKIIVPMPDTPKADITDYFNAGHSKSEFEQMIKQEQSTVTENRKEVAEHDTISKKPSRKEQVKDIVSLLIKYQAAQNYSTTDKGSGALFADIFKDKHRYNPEWKDFAYYDGKRWVKDIEGMKARTSAKMLVDALLQYTAQAGLDEKAQSSYFKFVYQLAQLKNRNAMLNDAKDKYCFCNSDLDQDNDLLNCQNGVLSLKSGKVEFMEHKADLLLSKICNVEYDPAAICEHWIKFLDEIMQGDAEKIKYLQKIAGISLTGDTREETMFILYGATTRNGKSTFTETIGHLLGDYALTMRPETLAVKQNNDSRQANGDIARLKGVRFVNASEPPKRMIFDIALIKTLLGRDSITARHLHEREFEFVPVFKLVINTNYLPQILDDTVFSSGRINVVSFDRHFEPQEQDKNLKDRLRDRRELSGILNWCIEGLELYRKEGLKPPTAVEASTADYRQQSDKIGNFINEMLIKSGRNSKAKDIYEAYAKWCDGNGYGCENKGNFFAELKNKGLFIATGTIDGKTVKNVVKGYELGFIELDVPSPFD